MRTTIGLSRMTGKYGSSCQFTLLFKTSLKTFLVSGPRCTSFKNQLGTSRIRLYHCIFFLRPNCKNMGANINQPL